LFGVSHVGSLAARRVAVAAGGRLAFFVAKTLATRR
jgi:hypothetical protein